MQCKHNHTPISNGVSNWTDVRSYGTDPAYHTYVIVEYCITAAATFAPHFLNRTLAQTVIPIHAIYSNVLIEWKTDKFSGVRQNIVCLYSYMHIENCQYIFSGNVCIIWLLWVFFFAYVCVPQPSAETAVQNWHSSKIIKFIRNEGEWNVLPYFLYLMRKFFLFICSKRFGR